MKKPFWREAKICWHLEGKKVEKPSFLREMATKCVEANPFSHSQSLDPFDRTHTNLCLPWPICPFSPLLGLMADHIRRPICPPRGVHSLMGIGCQCPLDPVVVPFGPREVFSPFTILAPLSLPIVIIAVCNNDWVGPIPFPFPL